MLTAGFFDLLSIIPLMNIPIAIIAWLTFAFWFLYLGIGLTSPRRLAAPAISFLVELFPGLSAAPSLSLAIAVSIGIIRFEEGKLGWLKKLTKNPLKKDATSEKGGGGTLAKNYQQSQIISTPPNSSTPKPATDTARQLKTDYGYETIAQPPASNLKNPSNQAGNRELKQIQNYSNTEIISTPDEYARSFTEPLTNSQTAFPKTNPNKIVDIKKTPNDNEPLEPKKSNIQTL